MGCNQAIDLTCGGSKQYAACVKYEGVLPQWSSLDQCANLKETTSELYSEVESIKQNIDLSTIDLNCLTLSGEKNIKNLVQLLLDKVCILEQANTDLTNSVTTLQQQVQDLQQNNCP